MEVSGSVVAGILLRLSFVDCVSERMQEFPAYYAGECLEDPPCDFRRPYRTYDGSCSSLGGQSASWGRAGSPFARTGPPTYHDDVSSPRLAKDGGPLPNARTLSSTLFRDKLAPDRFNTLNVVFWGQFVAHDITQKRLAFAGVNVPCCTTDFQMLRPESLPKECLPVEVSKDDDFYSKYNVSCLSFYRATALETGHCSKYPREQINNISHVIDGSVLYGSDEKTARAMRSFVDGKLKVDVSRDGRPFLTNDSDPAIPCLNPPSERKCYFAGDERVNQNPGMLVLSTALLRLHNYLCEQMAVINPHWRDETIYQEVRRIIGACLQHVTFKHYLPALLGREFCERKGLLVEGHGRCINFHDPEINPAMYHEFSGAAFRSFHSMVARELPFVNNNFEENGSINIDDFIFRPSFVEYHGAFDELMRGMADRPCQKMDQHVTVGLTNFFFKQNRSFGGDLEILDIMSGRDMGLPPYIKMRYLCGHKIVKDFEDLGDVMTKESIWQLKKLYSYVEDIDLFVGGMMEAIIPGTLVGPTFRCVIGEQFYRSMRGDRFYYENCGFPWSFTAEQIEAIRKTTVAWIFCVTGDDVNYIPLDTFSERSFYNPILRCDEIPGLDIFPWIDYDGSKI